MSIEDEVCYGYIRNVSLNAAARDTDGGFTNPIRLVINSTLPGENEGTIEIFYNGSWGTICDDYWGFSEAEVACHMLGFSSAVRAYSRL